jgi:hypothetical protein
MHGVSSFFRGWRSACYHALLKALGIQYPEGQSWAQNRNIVIRFRHSLLVTVIRK